MAKFNTGSMNTAVAKTATSPVKTKDSGNKVVNASGHLGFQRGVKSELFLLSVANFVGVDTFYEKAKERDDRFVKLCREVAVDDSVWFGGFVRWLRNDAFMRSAAIVAAAEGAHAILGQKRVFASPRGLVASSMARADEPGEFLAYWNGKFGAKSIPASVKKGLADAVVRLYNEYSTLKYDTGNGIRFGQILQVTHPKASDPKQNDLFQYILNKNYGSVTDIPDNLTMLYERQYLMNLPIPARRNILVNGETVLTKATKAFQDAGMTWEALAGWLQGPMDAKAWEAIIPNMGYMALLRNLRNFLEAGVDAKTMDTVLSKLSDPYEVARSKQFPFRFLSAWQAVKSNLKVSAALEDALQASLSNVPVLKGKTLVLVDRSGSMFTYSGGTQGLDRADTAALFGSALALRADKADLVQFGTGSRKISFNKGDSLLPLLEKFGSLGGTDTASAVANNLNGHDRVIIVTDEQYNGAYKDAYMFRPDPLSKVPADIPIYTWNLGGYAVAHAPSGRDNRHTFGGLTDKAFQMIPLLEAGQSQTWPWLGV